MPRFAYNGGLGSAINFDQGRDFVWGRAWERLAPLCIARTLASEKTAQVA